MKNNLRKTVVFFLLFLMISTTALAAPDKMSASKTKNTADCLDAFRGDELETTGAITPSTKTIKPADKQKAAKKKAKPKQKKDKKQTAKQNSGETKDSKLKTVPESDPFLPKSKVKDLIKTAKKYIGVRYKFGGTTPKGFDCSGYLQYVFKQHGFNLPRTADEQYKLGKRTKNRKELVEGDLVYFTTYEPGASHCGIYLGDGKFIHASSSKGIRIDSLDNEYWNPRFYGGKHIVK